MMVVLLKQRLLPNANPPAISGEKQGKRTGKTNLHLPDSGPVIHSLVPKVPQVTSFFNPFAAH
jgi:hypothetical protein